jgi:hypothetical protein
MIGVNLRKFYSWGKEKTYAAYVGYRVGPGAILDVVVQRNPLHRQKSSSGWLVLSHLTELSQPAMHLFLNRILFLLSLAAEDMLLQLDAKRNVDKTLSR